MSCIGFSKNSEHEDDTGQTPGAEEINANLSALSISVGALRFDPDITTYNVEVAHSVASITCTATVANQQASLQINGAPADSGKPFGPIDLVVGQNTIRILVTALDVTKTYTVVVTRLKGISHNADLSNLTISQGALTPAFNANTLAYTAEVPHTVPSLAVTPTAAGVNASITVNGSAVASGAASASIGLSVGVTAITIVITAEDGATTKTYIVQVTRLAAPSTNADLSNLAISQGTLTPAFNPATFAYTAQVPNTVSSLTITPTAAGTNATITVNGVAVESGSPAQAVGLIVGETTIAVIVTAEDNVSTKTYTITATRLEAPSTNAALSNLAISQGTLTPAFNPATFAYTAQVPNTVSSLAVTPTAAGVGARITVNGEAVVSGMQSPAQDLNVGSNTITIMVMAQDGVTTKTYTIVVTRLAAPSTNADLSNLTISEGTLSPAFNTATFAYTAQVPYAVQSLTVTPTAAGVNASITVNSLVVASGASSQSIALAVGVTAIDIVITAEDGATTKTYTVQVTRLAALSTNADLSGLTISQGALSPDFLTDTLAYTAQVANDIETLTVAPTAAGTNATITVNGVAVDSGNPSQTVDLIVGDSTITVIVTAEDGVTKKTYTIVVTRS